MAAAVLRSGGGNEGDGGAVEGSGCCDVEHRSQGGGLQGECVWECKCAVVCRKRGAGNDGKGRAAASLNSSDCS